MNVSGWVVFKTIYQNIATWHWLFGRQACQIWYTLMSALKNKEQHDWVQRHFYWAKLGRSTQGEIFTQMIDCTLSFCKKNYLGAWSQRLSSSALLPKGLMYLFNTSDPPGPNGTIAWLSMIPKWILWEAWWLNNISADGRVFHGRTIHEGCWLQKLLLWILFFHSLMIYFQIAGKPSIWLLV